VRDDAFRSVEQGVIKYALRGCEAIVEIIRMEAMKTTRITFPIDNVRCGGALMIERALTRTPGVISVYVNPTIEMAYVAYHPSVTESKCLIAAIERMGFRVGVPSIR